MLGSQLKQARETHQLTLNEVEWATKIRGEYLQALEDEQFDKLPSGTHARGFLRSYARYLGLDPDPLVDEYNHASSAATEIVSTRPAVAQRRRDFTLTPGMIIGAALLILIGIFGLYLKTQFDKYQASRAADAQPTPQLHLSELPTPSPTPLPSPSPSASVPAGAVVVLVRVDLPTWLQIDVDGKPSAETGSGGKTVPAGTQLTLTGARSVAVFSGKAAHTFITVNGKDLGAMPPGGGGTGNQTYTRGA
ncbi:MAG TPA: RodZ domain-containing protein [Candidatus Dormibacteraeota bacterium]|jgi:cytoskeletal protein RodZ